MVKTKEESISILLKNFIESQKDVELAFLYSREGLLMEKFGKIICVFLIEVNFN